MKRIVVCTTVICAAVFVSAALAAGNGPTSKVYCNEASCLQKSVTTPPSTTLPFTGLDLAFACVAGIVLVGAGLTLRRLARRPPPR